MSELSAAPVKAMRQALCLACGTTRHAKVQYLGRGSRTLRCQSCQRATMHAAVNWEGVDDREEANRRQTTGETDAGRDLDALLALFRSCAIDIWVAEDDDASPGADPLGGLVEVLRWLERERFQVRLQRGLSLADRVYCLDWAWKSMRPAVARWHRCPIEVDASGELIRRIHNNAKELGLYSPS